MEAHIKKEQDSIPKGIQRFTHYETTLIKAARQLTKAVQRLQKAAAELESRPLPKPAPKPEKKARAIRLSQLTIPGTKPARKVAKSPAKRQQSRVRRG